MTLLEALSPVIFTRPGLSFAKYLYGYTYRGLWWSLDAVESYQAICQLVISLFESSSDSRSMLDSVLNNAQELAEVLGIPFGGKACKIASCSNALQFGDTESLSMLSSETPLLKMVPPEIDFEIGTDPAQFGLFTRILASFRSQLIDQIQIIGYASCKILLQNSFQVNAKEENFALLCTQMLDMFLTIIGPRTDRLQWSPLYFQQKDLQRLLSAVKFIDDSSTCVNLAKTFIQSFEFFKFKNSGKQEFAVTGNGPNSYLFIKPAAYFSHTLDKSTMSEYLFVEILTALAFKIKSFDQAVWDNEARLFIDDFFVYLRAQFSKSLSKSLMFLHLAERVSIALDSSVDELGALLSSPVYRHDEQAVVAMTLYLASSLKQSSKSFTKLKPFIDSVLKRHFKWKLKGLAKSVSLDLLILLCELRLLPAKDLFKCLLDPSPHAYDLWPEKYNRLFAFADLVLSLLCVSLIFAP
jgi:hypothetical protein